MGLWEDYSQPFQVVAWQCGKPPAIKSNTPQPCPYAGQISINLLVQNTFWVFETTVLAQPSFIPVLLFLFWIRYCSFSHTWDEAVKSTTQQKGTLSLCLSQTRSIRMGNAGRHWLDGNYQIITTEHLSPKICVDRQAGVVWMKGFRRLCESQVTKGSHNWAGSVCLGKGHHQNSFGQCCCWVVWSCILHNSAPVEFLSVPPSGPALFSCETWHLYPMSSRYEDQSK